MIPNDPHGESWVFTQVKNFMAPPYMTAPPHTPGLDPPLMISLPDDHDHAAADAGRGSRAYL